MKPSLQSHYFRFVPTILSFYVASKAGLEGWCKLAAVRNEKPVVPPGVQLRRIKIDSLPAEWLIPA